MSKKPDLNQAVVEIGSVKIPLLDYAVSCNAILGIRDSGKTVTAKGIAEQLLDYEIPIIVFDAVGKWRWMKVPGSGPRARGYKVVVAGGRAPDLALNAHSVGEIVRSAVKEKIPLIIDLYDPNLSKADWRRIVQQSIRIIHYEADGVAHVFLEEAAEYIPQKVSDTHTYAEVEKLARMGGNASVGLTLINQRSQEVNKAVLDLAHNLVLGCQIGNRAIDAVEKWVDRLSPATAKEVTTSLPHLSSGEAWVWTRTNLDDPKRERLPMCRSLHPDRRTPEIALSAKASDPKEFVDRLSKAIPKLIEEAKAKDPVELAKRVRTLEEQLSKATTANPAKVESKIVEKPVVLAPTLAKLEKLQDRLRAGSERMEKISEELKASTAELNSALLTVRTAIHVAPFKAPVESASPAPTPSPERDFAVPYGDKLPPRQQDVINAIYALERLGTSQPSREAVALFVGRSVKPGRWSTDLRQLQDAVLITYPNQGALALTEEGRARATTALSVASREDLHNSWRRKLPPRQVEILNALLAVYPAALSREDLAARVNRSTAPGRWSTDLRQMKTLCLIDYPESGSVRASDLLHPAGLK